jgi:hypothetical protein
MNNSTPTANAASSPAAKATFFKTPKGNQFTVARITESGEPPFIRVYLDSTDFDLGISFKLDLETAVVIYRALRVQAERLVDDQLTADEKVRAGANVIALFDGGAA